MNENEKPPLYVEHAGTIRVAGASKPLHLAQCAQGLISQKSPPIENIEFFYIGGNAGQQAVKAMTILSYQVDRESRGRTEALFRPLRVMTSTKDPDTSQVKEKDATVWRLVLVNR